nr:MmgE/PrpD family protein [uncultured Oscillibacter sp.]
METQITKALSDFITDIRFEDLNGETTDYTKMCVQDLLGVSIAGQGAPAEKIWAAYYSGGDSQPGEAARWTPGFQRTEYHKAAAYNAACSHLLDLDDVHNASITHPGTVTIPAAMAVAQIRHSSGRELIAAVTGGYEAAARIGAAINPGAYWYWHTTGVVGAFSSAAAAGKLIGLDKAQMLHAFGSAGTQAAGLWEFLEDGSMSKSLHTANATLCGIRAAELASLGFTGASRVLEGRKGFLGALNPKANIHALTESLIPGQYQIMSNSLKPYACCRHIHSAIHGMRLLAEAESLDPERIVKITDYTYQVAKDTASNPAPPTDYAYKFSIQYGLAAALLYGELLEDAFSGEKTQAPEAQRLMSKVEVVVDPELQEAYEKNPTRWAHTLEVRMDDGRILYKSVAYPPGDFQNPFSWEMADRKFLSITAGKIPKRQAEKIMENIRRLDCLEDVNELFRF